MVKHSLKGSKSLVIGGAGFIGSHVVSELLKEHVDSVVIYDIPTVGNLKNIEEYLHDPRCQLYPHGGDVRNTDILNDSMKGADYVFHLAAMWLLHCRDFPRTAFDVNVTGTFNVLEACASNKIKKLVYSSSASVYGDAIEVPMTEDHPFNNRNFYGATKIAGESMCRAFHDRFGLDFVGLRYMNVYGPKQRQDSKDSGVIPLMLNKVDAGEQPIINGDGSQAYDFVYVEDAARFNIEALKSETTDEFFNVGTGVPTTLRELCDLIIELKDSDLQPKYVPYQEGDARRFVKSRIGSTEKSERILGFQSKCSLREGLERLIEWRDNGNKR